MKVPSYDLRSVSIGVVKELCKKYHGYGSASSTSTYAFAVFEDDIPIAAYAWQPPPVGASKSVCPECPQGVLALSRMVAVPKADRKLNHVSKPLRQQMHKLIDRTRWPVLITYSDEGQGHTGHVYKCSGWKATKRSRNPYYIDADGKRASSYSNGMSGCRDLVREGYTVIQRWEHWICPEGEALNWMEKNGWQRLAVPGKLWASGNQAYRYERVVG